MKLLLFLESLSSNLLCKIKPARINEILSYAVGRDVPVVDAFRLGKQKRPTADQSVEGNSKSRPRPVLVNLGCVWACRVVLLAKLKLLDFEGGKYFVCGDMPADE